MKSRLVKSSSSDHPHIVKTNLRNLQQYLCDDKCPMYKAFPLCSHVIAAAHENCDLQFLLQYYTDSQHGPNLTALQLQGMPSGFGRICRACRKNYEGENDTLALVVAHAERRMSSNLATGTQFLGIVRATLTTMLI